MVQRRENHNILKFSRVEFNSQIGGIFLEETHPQPQRHFFLLDSRAEAEILRRLYARRHNELFRMHGAKLTRARAEPRLTRKADRARSGRGREEGRE